MHGTCSPHLEVNTSPNIQHTSSISLSPEIYPLSHIPISQNNPVPTSSTLNLQPSLTNHSLLPTLPSHSITIPKIKPTTSIHPMTTRDKAGIFKPKAYLTSHNSLEPTIVSEALSDPKWEAAMQTEYDALIKNNT